MFDLSQLLTDSGIVHEFPHFILQLKVIDQHPQVQVPTPRNNHNLSQNHII
jgi:hypothetical protein